MDVISTADANPQNVQDLTVFVSTEVFLCTYQLFSQNKVTVE